MKPTGDCILYGLVVLLVIKVVDFGSGPHIHDVCLCG